MFSPLASFSDSKVRDKEREREESSVVVSYSDHTSKCITSYSVFLTPSIYIKPDSGVGAGGHVYLVDLAFWNKQDMNRVACCTASQNR